MAVLTNSARVFLAQSILSRPIYLAIGSAYDWGITPEAVDYQAVSLINEIGRKKLTRAFSSKRTRTARLTCPADSVTRIQKSRRGKFICTSCLITARDWRTQSVR